MLTVIIAVSSGAGSIEEDDYMKFLMEISKTKHFLVKHFTESEAKYYVQLHSKFPFDSITDIDGTNPLLLSFVCSSDDIKLK